MDSFMMGSGPPPLNSYPTRNNSNYNPNNPNPNGYNMDAMTAATQDMSISGPLALGGFPSGGSPTPNLGRRPTNFGLHPSGSTASLTALNTAELHRRPSTTDVPTPVSAVPPMPAVPNNAGATGGGGGVMEVGLPTPAKPPTATPVKSLFQSCMMLIEKLYGFPLFEFYLFPDGVEMYQTDPPPLIDPVAILWGCFRLGAPLCMLYNQLNPRTPLNVSDVSAIRPPKYTNVCKDNVYHFIVACKNDLGLSEKDVFSISELYKDDTNGFVKVMKTVNMLVEKIESRGAMPPKRPLPFSVPQQEQEAPSDNRSKLVNELIDTERKYIHDLEVLQNYEKEIIHQNLLTRDGVHSLFANLDELLDFQRRFLIAMESTLSLPTSEQRIGQLFIMNVGVLVVFFFSLSMEEMADGLFQQEEYFSVYHAFCANYQFATTFALGETEKLAKLSTIIPPHMLQSYLIKPVQRVCKYPLLLQELVKLSNNTSYPYMDELKEGLESMKRVTERVNEQKRVEENRNMKNELIERVEDWKGLQPNEFGELLLYDKFPMTDNDREYNLYLFERILLCCKDLGKSKRKSKKNDKDNSPPQFALKGNIYINSITAVQDTSDVTIGVFGVKVFWKDVVDMESFSLKCRNEEQVKLWKERLEKQVELDRVRRRATSNDVQTNPLGLLYGSNSQLRGVAGAPTDDYPDSAYAASNYRPSFDSVNSFATTSSGQPGAPPGGYPGGAPGLARSRSIPHNYHPQQQGPPPPPGVQAQRKSQLAMSRGYGSQADMSMPPQGYYQAPRGMSSSPDPALGPNRSNSPPPIPAMPQYMFPQGHTRFASEGSLSYLNVAPGGPVPGAEPVPHSPIMTRQQSQGAIPAGRGYSNSGPTGMAGGSSSQPAAQGYYRHNSGQGGVNLPAPPQRTFSAAAAALAAAASTGSAPPVGYSDDELSDDEYYAAQQRQRLASQHQISGIGLGAARFNDSPTPQSPKLQNGNMGLPAPPSPLQQQRRSQHNGGLTGPAAAYGPQRGLPSGVPNINTVARKASVHSTGEDGQGGGGGGTSPITPGNPFVNNAWRQPPPPSHPPPPVPPMPANAQQLPGISFANARGGSIPEASADLPSTSPPTAQFLSSQQQRAAYSPGIKASTVPSPYAGGQGGYPEGPSASQMSRSPSANPAVPAMAYGKPGPMGGPPQMPLPPPPSAGIGMGGAPLGPPPSMPLPQAPAGGPPNMRRAPTAPLPSLPPSDGPGSGGSASLHSPLPNPNPPASGGPPSAAASAAPAGGAGGAGYFKVRTHYESDVFVIAIPYRGATFAELQERIERKIRLCGSQSPADLGRKIRIRYRDEDGDLVAINGDEDVALAFEVARRSTRERGVLNLFVS
ncbi:hypothetical protein HDU96_009219 [Phlyctochytrium bullatum]|nr:hypothetical protein HDU96_009219 [Phlyctochytrium bullatum]